MANDPTLARRLGYLSLGLGLTQLLAPRWVSRTIGVRAAAASDGLVRLVGARELIAAVGLLTSRQPAKFVWFRVGGDLMDLALLGRAASDRGVADPQRLNGTLASLVGVTAVDVLSGLSTPNDGGNGANGTQAGRDGQRMISADRAGGLGERVRDGVFGGKPVRKAITIGRTPSEVYGYWRQLENLPRFMRHLESVVELGDGRSHWVATAPLGASVEWDAEITEDIPGQRLSWTSVAGADVRHAGTVRFVPAPGQRGTEVHVELTYQPPAGPVGVASANLFGEGPEQQVGEALRRLKQVMETGRVAVSEATGGERRLRQRPAQPVAAGH